MPYTEEPRGLKILNNLNSTALATVVSQFLWAVGSLALTAIACRMLLTSDGIMTAQGAVPAYPISHDSIRSLGFALAGALLAAWTGKSVIGGVVEHGKRTTSTEYKEIIEAKERGSKVGTAQALALATAAKEITTQEHAAPATVTVKSRGSTEVSMAPVAEEDPTREPATDEPHDWATGDPRAGVL